MPQRVGFILMFQIMGSVYQNLFCLSGGPVLYCEHMLGGGGCGDEVSYEDSDMGGWENCLASGYFVKGAEGVL